MYIKDNLEYHLKHAVFEGFTSQNLFKIFWVQHSELISLMKLTWRSSLQSILKHIFLDLKHHSIEKNVFFVTLRSIFRCLEWKYCAVPENIFFYVCFISSLFLSQVFTFLSIEWVRFKTWLAKGPIPDLAYWTGFLTKY